MSKTITQKIIFKNISAATLYELYMDAKKHSAVTGAEAKINQKEGSVFTSYGDYIAGKNLQLIKNKLIVQSWRASDWTEEDIDSTFIIELEEKENGTTIYVTHANVPLRQAKSLSDGWHKYYWNPWKAFLGLSSPKRK